MPFLSCCQLSLYFHYGLCHTVTVSICHTVTVSICHTVTVSFCHTVTVSICHTVTVSSLSYCHCVHLSYCHCVLFMPSANAGANFSVHKEKAKKYDPQGAVGSVYKKTDARSDITGQRDAFWAKSEREEEERRAREVEEKRQKRLAEDRERKERDVQAAAARERAADERFKKVQQQK